MSGKTKNVRGGQGGHDREPAVPLWFWLILLCVLVGVLVLLPEVGVARAGIAGASPRLPAARSPRDMASGVAIYVPYLAAKLPEPDGKSAANPPPEAASSQPVSASKPNWLEDVNAMRAIGKLPPLTENPTWSLACWEHARYMVKNGILIHDENQSDPWFTSQGLYAARNSDLLLSSAFDYPDRSAIAGWMTAPFHGIGILDPTIRQTGFASYREAGGSKQMGACLNVLGDIWNNPWQFSPVTWPADGGEMPFLAYHGGEWPDPLTACQGYAVPTGAPVYLLVGAGEMSPEVSERSLTLNGVKQDTCLLTESNYTNPDMSLQALGRAVLDSRNAIVLIPRQPLEAGSVYNVSVTVSGKTYSWSFSTPGDAQVVAKDGGGQ